MILLIFATELEAAPFIDYHRLRPLKGHLLHPLYEGDGLSLTISGMGFLRGALAHSRTLEMQQERGDPVTRVLNYGIAGSLTERFSLGDAVGVHKVMKYNPVEFTRPRFNKHFASAFPEILVNEQEADPVVLATSDHPVMIEDDARCAVRYAHLVDMEGYGYAFAARQFGIPIQLIKGISDYARKESEPLFRNQVKKALDSLQLFEEHNYTDYLYLHGLSVESAEALAEMWHKRMREELGIAGDDSPDMTRLFRQEYRGSRYSFGYPACPNLEDQAKLCALLQPERIGVGFSEEFQLEPEQSTSAIIVHHPEAKYFNVG